jgi:hypothetical protein
MVKSETLIATIRIERSGRGYVAKTTVTSHAGNGRAFDRGQSHVLPTRRETWRAGAEIINVQMDELMKGDKPSKKPA